MDELTVYQNMSQLVFNAIMRGEPRDKALKDAEDTLKELLQRSKDIASSLAASAPAPAATNASSPALKPATLTTTGAPVATAPETAAVVPNAVAAPPAPKQ